MNMMKVIVTCLGIGAFGSPGNAWAVGNPTRQAQASFPIQTYHYALVTSISKFPQTVTIKFVSSKKMMAGGFKNQIDGYTIPGPGAAGTGVVCAANGLTCSIKKTLAYQESLRAGVRFVKPVPDYQYGGPGFTTGTNIGLTCIISVDEPKGHVVATGLTWMDIDVNLAAFIDVSTPVMFAGGKPF